MHEGELHGLCRLSSHLRARLSYTICVWLTIHHMWWLSLCQYTAYSGFVTATQLFCPQQKRSWKVWSYISWNGTRMCKSISCRTYITVWYIRYLYTSTRKKFTPNSRRIHASFTHRRLFPALHNSDACWDYGLHRTNVCLDYLGISVVLGEKHAQQSAAHRVRPARLTGRAMSVP